MRPDPRRLSRSQWRARLRDPRIAGPIVAIVLAVGVVALAAGSGALPFTRPADGSPAPTASAPVGVLPASFSPIPDLTPVPADATPEGVHRRALTSASISPRPTLPPTPTPDPNVWRFEGTVVDGTGKPLQGVCVIVGPKGCRPGSIRTDTHGRYYIDLPRNPNVIYDLFYALEGHEVVWYRTQPQGPTVFNVVLYRL